MDRTSHERPSEVERRKAKRLGRAVPARDELRRKVRAAASAARDEEEFFVLLADAGVLVTKRHSATDPDEITGYSVALPTDTTKAGTNVYYGGGKLARDLTLPRLRQRWIGPDGAARARAAGGERVSVETRIASLTAAAEAIRGASDAMDQLGQGGNSVAAVAVAQAAADTLAAIASTLEGTKGGPITTAAELFDKAARDRNGALAAANRRSFDLRAMSRLVHVMGRVSGERDTHALLVLLHDLARLADTLAALRSAQDRYHQAQAALDAATTLRAAARATGRLTRSGIPDRPDRGGAPRAAPAAASAVDPQSGRPTSDGDQHRHGR